MDWNDGLPVSTNTDWFYQEIAKAFIEKELDELLHILGLEEVKEKGKKLIRRRQEGCRNDGSLLENTCNFLKTRGRLSVLSDLQQYGADANEQCFSVALELCITWLNRLLFLKLLEEQLIGYHKGDRSYAFLNSRRSSIEPIIGHAKSDHRMDRNYLKGEEDDKTNAILAGCGFNIRKLLRAIFLWLFNERLRDIANNWIALTRILGQHFQPV